MKTLAWLMWVSGAPAGNPSIRMRIWRALKAAGAGALRDGVYVLPNSDAAHTVFQEQARAVEGIGGNAQIIAFDSADAGQQAALERLFDRGAEYAALLEKCGAFRTGLDGIDEVEARRQLAVLRRDTDALIAMDYFAGPARTQAMQSLADLENAVNLRFAPDEPHASSGEVARRTQADYRGRTWATRQHLWIDRVASAWLIRRFIDPDARFLWLDSPQACPPEAVGFDFDGAEFTHVGARVSFEVLAAAFGLRDAGIARLGAVVHFLDVGGVPAPEAAGLAAIMAGARASAADDDALLMTMTPVLDSLYAAYREPATRERGDPAIATGEREIVPAN